MPATSDDKRGHDDREASDSKKQSTLVYRLSCGSRGDGVVLCTGGCTLLCGSGGAIRSGTGLWPVVLGGVAARGAVGLMVGLE